MASGAEEGHAGGVKKDQVKVQQDPGTWDNPMISWLKGQTEEGSFGNWEAWALFCHIPQVPSPRGDANLLGVLLANAHAIPGRGRVGPVEIINLDFPRSYLFIWRAGICPLPSTRWRLSSTGNLESTLQDGFIIEMSAFSFTLDGVTQLLKMKSSESLQFSLSFSMKEVSWIFVARNFLHWPYNCNLILFRSTCPHPSCPKQAETRSHAHLPQRNFKSGTHEALSKR